MPIRTCIITRQKKEQKEFIRIGIENGEIKIGNKLGRGIYLTPSLETFEPTANDFS